MTAEHTRGASLRASSAALRAALRAHVPGCRRAPPVWRRRPFPSRLSPCPGRSVPWRARRRRSCVRWCDAARCSSPKSVLLSRCARGARTASDEDMTAGRMVPDQVPHTTIYRWCLMPRDAAPRAQVAHTTVTSRLPRRFPRDVSMLTSHGRARDVSMLVDRVARIRAATTDSTVVFASLTRAASFRAHIQLTRGELRVPVHTVGFSHA